MIGEADKALEASRLLEDEGFLAIAIRPPTVPDGTARLRFTFTAQHPDDEIERAASIVRDKILVRLIMAAYFVTSTGTDIGKTFVTAGLIRQLRIGGAAVDALKPVVSGYDSSVVETSDPAVLLGALGRPVTADEVERIAPWRFRAPLSPDLAAAREGRTIDFDALIAFSRARHRRHPRHAVHRRRRRHHGSARRQPHRARLDGGARHPAWCWWSAAISAPSATR